MTQKKHLIHPFSVTVGEALPFKLPRFGALLRSFANNNQKVLREHKGDALPLVPKLLLFVVKEVTKVYVEQL